MRLILSENRSIDLKKFILGFLFIFSFQIFYTTKDFPILFYTTRLILPVIAFVLALIWIINMIINRVKIPYAVFLIFSFFFLVIVNTLVSNINFGQPINFGITAQFKLLSVFYFFLVLYVLLTFNYSKEDITGTIVFLGFLCFVVYYLLNIFVDPKELYHPGSELIYYDPVKGYRYKFRTIFGVISLFLFFRIFLKTYNIKYFFIALFFLGYITFFSKGRFELLSILLTLFFASVEGKSIFSKLGWSLFFLMCVLLILNFVPHFYTILDGDDTSGSIRLITLKTVFITFKNSPENLLLGFGYLNPLFEKNYNSVFGDSFFIADVGWIGLLFEFGIIGIVIFLSFYFILYKESVYKNSNPLIQKSIKDFIIKTIITSILTPSIPYLWGIYASLLAILVYLNYFSAKVYSEEEKA